MNIGVGVKTAEVKNMNTNKKYFQILLKSKVTFITVI